MSSIALPLFNSPPPRRGIVVAVALSLLAHVLLVTLAPKPRENDTRAPGPVMDVVIVQAPAVQLPTPQPEPQAPQVPQKRPQPIVRKPPPHPVPREPSPPPVPVPAPPTPTVAPTPPTPTFDMAAMIRARQAQRRAAEAQMAAAPSQPSPPSPEDAAAASLNRNLQSLSGQEGIGGVFQILHMGTRTGEFAFNGWRNEGRRRWREVIEVDAGEGGNLELAMVRRMIQLIRSHYVADFNWESHRLQRTVILSARPEDTAELEDFLMREFFGTPLEKPK